MVDVRTKLFMRKFILANSPKQFIIKIKKIIRARKMIKNDI